MLQKAKKEKKAIFQFNINNLEWTKWILEKCNELSNPIILGVSESAIRYMGGYDVVVSLVKSLIYDLNVSIDVCLHLDHSSSFESCQKAIDAGFTSVMIDLSKESLVENILGTKKVVAYAHSKNVLVEAELGMMGKIVDNKVDFGNFVDVTDYIKFVDETGIDTLAPSVGTVHGLYTGELNINYQLINDLANIINVPLVLHGGSGLSNEILKKCIENGITKININSDLQHTWSKGVRDYLNSNKDIIDPRKIISSGENMLKDEIEHKININN